MVTVAIAIVTKYNYLNYSYFNLLSSRTELFITKIS